MSKFAAIAGVTMIGFSTVMPGQTFTVFESFTANIGAEGKACMDAYYNGQTSLFPSGLGGYAKSEKIICYREKVIPFLIQNADNCTFARIDSLKDFPAPTYYQNAVQILDEEIVSRRSGKIIDAIAAFPDSKNPILTTFIEFDSSNNPAYVGHVRIIQKEDYDQAKPVYTQTVLPNIEPLRKNLPQLREACRAQK